MCLMGNNVVKGGTPVGSTSLCRTCTRALVLSGYRESERLTVCNWPDPSMAVPFVVYECSGYYDKNRPSWQQMEKLALDVTREPIKPVGFKTGIGFGERVTLARPAENDDDAFS